MICIHRPFLQLRDEFDWEVIAEKTELYEKEMDILFDEMIDFIDGVYDENKYVKILNELRNQRARLNTFLPAKKHRRRESRIS